MEGFRALCDTFRTKYQRYESLRGRLAEHQWVLEDMYRRLTAVHAQQQPEELAKIEDQVARELEERYRDSADRLNKEAHEFCILHRELELIKRECWRAYKNGIVKHQTVL